MKSHIVIFFFITLVHAQYISSNARETTVQVFDSVFTDVFPLTVDNQWNYHYDYEYGNWNAPIEEFSDTGSVHLKIISMVVTVDSTRWTFQEHGIHWTNTNNMGWQGPTVEIDTFEIIEINSGNHRLYRTGYIPEIRKSVLPFVSNLIDTGRIFKYAAVDTTGVRSLKSQEYPFAPIYQFVFKQNIGLIAVSMSDGMTGFPFYSTHHSLNYSVITAVTSPSNSSHVNNFCLFQNYPNPFNPSTTIRYSLPSSAKVRLTIHDMLGRKIQTLIDEEQSAGWKEVQWNASNVASGIYFYKIQSGNFTEMKKMMLLK